MRSQLFDFHCLGARSRSVNQTPVLISPRACMQYNLTINGVMTQLGFREDCQNPSNLGHFAQTVILFLIHNVIYSRWHNISKCIFFPKMAEISFKQKIIEKCLALIFCGTSSKIQVFFLFKRNRKYDQRRSSFKYQFYAANSACLPVQHVCILSLPFF